MSVGRAAVLFVILTALFTWPQVLHPLSVPDNIDAYFNMWRVSWIAHQIPLDPSRLFDANIYHPEARTLLFSDAVLLQGIVAMPFLKLGLPAVLVTNGLVFAGFVLSGLGMFLLVRDLTNRTAPAILGGIVFAFAPFRFDHYFHLEMSWAQWMPLALWMVHRTITSGRWRDGLLAGLFVALQGYSSVYWLVFLAAGLVLAGPILISLAARGTRVRVTRSLLAGAVFAAVLLAPYISAYSQAATETGGRSRQEALFAYAAGPRHYLATSPGSLLYGSTTGTWGQHEKRLFPGLVVMALVAVALWPPFNRRKFAYLLMLAFAVDFSLGHRGLLGSWLYDNVFAFRGLRVPTRAGQLMLLAGGVLAAFGLSRLIDRFGATRPTVASRIAALAIILTTVEYFSRPMTLVPVQTSPSAVTEWLRAQPPGVVAEFPAPGPVAEGIPEVYYQYESTFHWRPLLNGYSGMYPAAYVDWIVSMQEFPAGASIAKLVERGVTFVILHEQFYAPGEYQRVVRELSQRTDMVAFGPFPDRAGESRAYRLLTAK